MERRKLNPISQKLHQNKNILLKYFLYHISPIFIQRDLKNNLIQSLKSLYIIDK